MKKENEKDFPEKEETNEEIQKKLDKMMQELEEEEKEFEKERKKTRNKRILLGLSFFLVWLFGFYMGTHKTKELIIDKGDYPKLHEIEYLVREKYLNDVDPKKLEDGVYKGYFYGLEDPYSSYLNEEEFSILLETTSGEYAGVGLVVSAGEDNIITVVSPIEGTPAHEADIQTGDKILAVNGEQFLGSELDKAVEIMRGEPETDVELTLQRVTEDENRIFDVTLTRKNITLESVKGEMLEEEIGYLSVISFDEHTADDFLRIKSKLEDEGAKKLVIDLRGNPGGLLSSVIKISDELLPEGPIVKTVDKDGEEIVEYSSAEYDDIPIVVLINEGSASASEILAGAIQDHKRGKIVGENSYGKGVVQQVFPMDDGSGVKLTVSEYFTPNDHKIHEIGVKPDIEVELPKDVKGIGLEFRETDSQLEKALEVLKKENK